MYSNSLLRSIITWYGCQGFYIKQSQLGTEIDSRDTERNSVWETVCSWKWRIASAIKYTVGGNIWWWTHAINYWVNSDVVYDMVLTFCIFSINLVTTFRLTTSCKFLISFRTRCFNEGKPAASFCWQVAAWFRDMFCNFYLVKCHKIPKNSTTTIARSKICTDLESLEF